MNKSNESKVRIDQQVNGFMSRNAADFSRGQVAFFADEASTNFAKKIFDNAIMDGVSYDQFRKAIVIVDDGFYNKMTKMENLFQEKP